jgi:hypothetical protein
MLPNAITNADWLPASGSVSDRKDRQKVARKITKFVLFYNSLRKLWAIEKMKCYMRNINEKHTITYSYLSVANDDAGSRTS